MVVLPAPVGPTRAKICPGLASRDMFLRIGNTRPVFEIDVLEAHVAMDRGQRDRLRTIIHFGGGIDHLEDAFRSGQGGLDGVIQIGQLAQRVGEVLPVTDEGGDESHADQVAQGQASRPNPPER